MPLTITMTPSSGSGASIEYLENALGAGKFARLFDPGGYIADIKRWRPPGTDGYIICRSGNPGRKMTLTVRYVGTIDVVIDNIQTDTTRMATQAFDITSSGATTTFYGCNLVPGSVIMATPYTAMDETNVYADITFQMTEDQPQ